MGEGELWREAGRAIEAESQRNKGTEREAKAIVRKTERVRVTSK